MISETVAELQAVAGLYHDGPRREPRVVEACHAGAVLIGQLAAENRRLREAVCAAAEQQKVERLADALEALLGNIDSGLLVAGTDIREQLLADIDEAREALRAAEVQGE